MIKKNSDKIDLIFIDIKLIDTELTHKTGIDLANKIRNQFNIPFVFTTGYDDDSYQDKGLALNPIAYLAKPFTQHQLKVVLKEYMRIHSTGNKPLSNNLSPNRNCNGICKHIKNGGSSSIETFFLFKDIICIGKGKGDNPDPKAPTIYTKIEKYYPRRDACKLKDLGPILPGNFIKISRQDIVNMDHITGLYGINIANLPCIKPNDPVIQQITRKLIDKNTIAVTVDYKYKVRDRDTFKEKYLELRVTQVDTMMEIVEYLKTRI